MAKGLSLFTTNLNGQHAGIAACEADAGRERVYALEAPVDGFECLESFQLPLLGEDTGLQFVDLEHLLALLGKFCAELNVASGALLLQPHSLQRLLYVVELGLLQS